MKQLNKVFLENPKYQEQETKRFDKIKNLIPNYATKGFPWQMAKFEIKEVPMKHLIQTAMFNCRPESQYTIQTTHPSFKDMRMPMFNETLFKFI